MYGEVEIYTVDASGKKHSLFKSRNQIQDESRNIIARLLSGDTTACINTIYLEYENVVSPTETVEVTSFPTTEGVEHYLNLSGNADYLRKRIALRPVVEENRIEFSLIVADDLGEHNVPFGGENVYSRVYGMALVAGHPTDKTQDKVFARKNFDVQAIKTTEELRVDWTLYC